MNGKVMFQIHHYCRIICFGIKNSGVRNNKNVQKLILAMQMK